jgi:hypothetical protein
MVSSNRRTARKHQWMGGLMVRGCLAALGLVAVSTVIGAPAAFACGGLVAPNGAVRLVNTTTLVTYSRGVEHYVTSFEYEGGGTRFGSIVPLPAVPTSVSRGGSWTLQRLEREVQPRVLAPAGAVADSAASGSAQVILRTQVDALDITVIKGGGPAVTDWVRRQGFTVSRDLPAMLDFYAKRSPIFLTATFDPEAEAARGLGLGDGTPVQVTIPTTNPWVPLHILSLAKDPDDEVQADVFMLTDRRPTILTGSGVTLQTSRPAGPQLLSDLRSDKGMGWIPQQAWFSYLKVDSPPDQLTYDLAADVSGAERPSLTAAAFPAPAQLLTPPPGPTWWLGPMALGALLAAGFAGLHRCRRRLILALGQLRRILPLAVGRIRTPRS